jgi:hypothetical protein
MTQVRLGWLAIKLVPRHPAVGLSGRVTNGMRRTEPSLLVWSTAASQLRLYTRHTNTLSTTGAIPFPQLPQSFARRGNTGIEVRLYPWTLRTTIGNVSISYIAQG